MINPIRTSIGLNPLITKTSLKSLEIYRHRRPWDWNTTSSRRFQFHRRRDLRGGIGSQLPLSRSVDFDGSRISGLIRWWHTWSSDGRHRTLAEGEGKESREMEIESKGGEEEWISWSRLALLMKRCRKRKWLKNNNEKQKKKNKRGKVGVAGKRFHRLFLFGCRFEQSASRQFYWAS